MCCGSPPPPSGDRLDGCHAKGFHLAQKGADTRAIQGYLGHRDIKSTVIYTELDPGRFKGFGKDI
jgi:site-specific recombinase XerD